MRCGTATAVAILFGLAVQAGAAQISVQDSIRKYRYLAKTARDRKEYVAAARYYAEFLQYSPDSVAGNYWLAQMRLKNGDVQGGKETLLRTVALDSTHINANILLYSIYIKADMPDSAALCLERVVQTKPEDAGKRRALADLYRRQGRTGKAIHHYEILVSQVAERDELYELLALLNEDVGRTDQALKWRRKLADTSQMERNLGERRESLETIVRLHLETGDVKSAYETLEQLARVDTANRYSYYSRIAALAEENEDKQVKLRAWEAMARNDARDLKTVAGLVEHHINAGRIGLATQWLHRGLSVDRSNAHLQLLHGDILALQGQEESALDAFERAKADPRWEVVAQQRIWQIRPPETAEEKLKKAFFRDSNQEGD